MKKDLLILAGISIGAIALGSVLFIYGYNSSESLASGNASSELAVVTRGINAPVVARKNFVIKNEKDLKKLWAFLYGDTPTTPKLPSVDFSRQEVIAVFAGEKPTGGYVISVSGIKNSSNQRVVVVTIDEPDPACNSKKEQTSPYEIVTIPSSTLPLTHKDTVMTKTCTGSQS